MPQKIAVVLFQLGGPDSLDAVEPFLYNLFLDPDIIDFPLAGIARRPLARLVSSLRAKKVVDRYKEIGGTSPILELTRRQASGLESSLRKQGVEARVFIAMRYWHPLTQEVIKQIQQEGFDRIILLPLYPHYSKATTLSSTNEWNRQTAKLNLNGLPTQLICCYPNHPLLIEAFVDNINNTYATFPRVLQREIDLVFSAHGLPSSFIERGDPYQLQIEETVRRILEEGKWDSPHILCYQSKVGRSKWLKPSLHDTLASLARRGRKRLLVVPVAFVTEHIETLHEIDIEAREGAIGLGIERFQMMPALNDHPKFIQCLTDLVTARMKSNYSPASKCARLCQQTPGSPEPVLCPWYEPKG